MALDNSAIQELLKKLDSDREAYLVTLSRAHETLARVLAQAQPQATPGILPHSPLSPDIPPSLDSRRTAPTSAFELGSWKKGSVFTGDSLESDDDESFFASNTLPQERFTEYDFCKHLETHEWKPHSMLVLEDLLKKRNYLDPSRLFELGEDEAMFDDDHDISHIYDVGFDGSALHVIRTESTDDTKAIWECLQSINTDDSRRQAVGRIAILREPPAVLFGAIHLTMDRHFDMDFIFRMLINDSQSKAYMKGCLKDDQRHHRSFVFSLKYHTIVGEGRAPLPWQESDENLESTRDHIPISTCSSVVALSFSGDPDQTLRRKSRRSKHVVGHVFDAFAPWRVLSIQCYPDWNSSVDVHESNRHYVNGPEAFLVTLLAEYRDAYKRFKDLNRRIVEIVTPPRNFIYNRGLRDELLFENNNYTYSRRYFWAFQTLALLNDEIEALILQYKETFTDDVWNGEHRYIWPGTKDKSARFSNWRKKMRGLKMDFEHEIQQLQTVLKANHEEQKDIKSLRDQLFSGTSVLESREAVNQARITVQQGYNIRLLTLVTIFFLPLTFVTSVFGMTNMPQGDNFVPFGVVTAAICLSTYLLIGVLNSPERAQSVFRSTARFFTGVANCFKSRTRRKKEQEAQERSRGNGQRRRASRSVPGLESQPLYTTGRRGSSKFPVAPLTQTDNSQVSQLRDSSIKFDLPDYEKKLSRPLVPSSPTLEIPHSDAYPGRSPADETSQQMDV